MQYLLNFFVHLTVLGSKYWYNTKPKLKVTVVKRTTWDELFMIKTHNIEMLLLYYYGMLASRHDALRLRPPHLEGSLC
jgi:hypothetical protein